MKSKIHPVKNWEISIIIMETDEGKKYKVTKRVPELAVSETKIFNNLTEAEKQFTGWLRE